MAQKILRTMQDDLKEAKEKQQQQARNDNSREDNVRNGAQSQIKNSLQQPTTNQKEPEAFETEQKTPVSRGLNSLNLSSFNPSKDGESESIISDITKMPDRNILKNKIDASVEDRKKEEENRKAIEDQRKRIEEEAQKRTEEQAKLEAERKVKEEEERRAQEEQRQIEEAIKKAEEETLKKEEEEKRKAEEETKLEAERLRAEEEAERQEEEARLKAEKERIEKMEEMSEEEKEKRRKEEEEEKETEEKKQRIERERERIEELKKREEELEELKKRQEGIAREEEIEKKIEAERKAREEEARRRAEELRRKEEEIKKAEEEAERQEEELARQEEEEIRKTEEEARKVEEEAEKIEQELARKEEELQQMEKEEKERIAELMRKEEERTEAEEELERKEEELKEKEREREKREELRKKMRAEILGEEIPGEETENEERGDIIAEDYAAETDRKGTEEREVVEDKKITEDEDAGEYVAIPASGQREHEDDFSANPAAKKTEEEPHTSKSDQELSSLIKRVSTAMNTTIKREDGATATTTQIVPDKDIKELIARMSKNLEKEREMLEKEHAEDAEEEISQRSDKISSQPDPIKKENSPAIEDELDLPDADAKPAEIPTEQPKESVSKEPKNPVAAMPKMPAIRQAANIAEAAAPQPEKPAGSYWSELHDTLKNTAQNPSTQAYSNAEETGLIVPKQAVQQEQNVPPQKPRESADDEYINPENRLIFGRQEFYSSMHKKVKPRTQQADLEEFKETVKEEEIKLSDEEEKKKLRHQIITKYKIQLFSMPWKKIIIFTVLLLSTIGITLYTLVPRLAPKQEAVEEIPTGESIAEIDQLIPQKITARQKDISALNYFDSEIDPWKSLADKSITRIIVNYDEHEIMLPRDEALKAILSEDNFKNMPQNVLELLGNKYSVLAFKNSNALRLGIVFKYDRNQEDKLKKNISDWSNTSARAEKIHNVMKALFVSSKVEERSATTFQPSVYSNVDIYYLNLPDTDTSMDYFTYKGYLVFTTSKSTTSEIIDLLQE